MIRGVVADLVGSLSLFSSGRVPLSWVLMLPI